MRYGDRYGLGAAPGGIPEDGGAATAAGDLWDAGVKAALSQGMSFLGGIGAGRSEADVIVVVQNAMVARLSAIVAAYPTAALAAVQSMLLELQTMKQEFINFCNNPAFTDGRASHQALYGTGGNDPGMIFYFDDNIQKLIARVTALGGVPLRPLVTSPITGGSYTPIGISTAGMSQTTMLLLAGLAFAFLRR